ncbi:MAG: hypothetical protein WC011_03495 [Candidatus Paceibacterota bacterium]
MTLHNISADLEKNTEYPESAIILELLPIYKNYHKNTNDDNLKSLKEKVLEVLKEENISNLKTIRKKDGYCVNLNFRLFITAIIGILIEEYPSSEKIEVDYLKTTGGYCDHSKTINDFVAPSISFESN